MDVDARSVHDPWYLIDWRHPAGEWPVACLPRLLRRDMGCSELCEAGQVSQ